MAGGPLPEAGGTELERLRSTVARYFPVYETRVGPQSLRLAVHTDPATLERKFDELRQALGTAGYIPLLRREMGEEFVEIVRRPRPPPPRQWLNWVLLAATLGTTSFAGAVIWLTYVGGAALGPTDFLYGAIFFAFPVLTILGLHESAHYLVARRRHLDATLPYFIPVPPPFLFGTFGAFISIREPFPDRKALFDVGAAGPLAGFVASVPIALVGMFLSVHAPILPANYCGPTILGQSYGNLLIGSTAFWAFLSLFIPVTYLHPLALAGWVGLLVTAINLLPAGSLDGGHVFRALVGERARYVSYAAALLLFGLSIFYLGWIIFGFLVLVLGLRHPPPLNDLTPLDRKRYAVGALVAVVLVTGFAIVPVSAPAGSLAFADPQSHAAAPTSPAVIATNLTVVVQNLDPVRHGLVFDVSVTNVTRSGPNGSYYLDPAELLAWGATAAWTFVLPGGLTVENLTGSSVSTPASDYVTLNGGSTGAILIAFSNSENATAVSFSLTAHELCASAGTGTASVGFSALY